MARHYTLDTKINALNQLDQFDSDLLLTSEKLKIPASTIKRWRTNQTTLRRDYNAKRRRYIHQLKADLQTEMLERGLAIVAKMDDETLDKAPLNQLATALGTLVNHALKLDEVIDEADEQEEKIVRFQFVSGDRITRTPPWSAEGIEESSEVQDSHLRETLGENRARENHVNGRSKVSRETWLVARPDLSDVESGLERLEAESDERDWYHD